MTYPSNRPPYISGQMPPNGDWRPPAPERKSRLVPALLGVLSVTAVLVVGGIIGLSKWMKPAAEGPAAAAAITLADAERFCNLEHVGMKMADGNKTLIINGQDDDGTDEFATEWGNIRCVLTNLGGSEALIEHIQSTRALDGRQTDSWGIYTAAWTYHPDAGLDITIQER